MFTQFVLPVIVLLLPVMAVVLLAVLFGRRLSGSCGGVGVDGTCTRCGRTAAEQAAAGEAGITGERITGDRAAESNMRSCP